MHMWQKSPKEKNGNSGFSSFIDWTLDHFYMFVSSRYSSFFFFFYHPLCVTFIIKTVMLFVFWKGDSRV